ncbi:cadherin repeat domain-containing protein [Fibrobacter sp.]|uniref:cadherin repeat domain-containing protein n=1 Tax=Fibrobacter sp. TaxID=35828 RepID=UPI0025B7BA1C|nr:cadherin repeat domain-containing protein [Fibrobacter sp.]MCI6437030.1 cadherin repeat domain-containing protein [Fibrobacter sp.]
MWFGKNIMTKLGLVLAMAVPALAADTYPLYYTGKTTAQNNDYWDSLMIFKAWGTTGVDIGGRSALPDESGATGTALGSLSLNDDKVELGGRLLIGGDLTGGNGGHTLNSGSARIRGAITLGNGTANNFKGTYCVTGASTVGGNDVVDGIIYADGTAMGDGQACAMSAEKPISQVFDYLSVPLLHDENVDYTQERIVVVNGTPQKVYGEIVADQKTVAIDVPKMEEGDSKLYDIYLKSITVRNGGRIIVRMPYNGGNRLVRIFLSESISFSGSPRKLQIVYVGKGAEFKDGKWNDVGDDSTVVKNLDYAGNLLFYAKDDITWGAFNGGDTIQGSYVTRGTLTMGTNVALAGQLISEKLIIPQDFNGRGFRYVPFDPPILKLEPTATGEAAYIVERDNASDKINITLDKVAATPISFEYCFEFKGTPDSEKGDGKPYASKEDFIGSLPLYENGACTSTEKASFEPGSLELVGSGIVLKVFNDNIIEDALESFNIRIVNLQGATLESGARDGYIELFVQDNDGKPFGENITVSGTEDIPYVFNAFNVINSDGDALTDYSVVIATFPSKGTLSYVNTDGDTVAVVKNQKIASTDIDAGKFVYKFVEDDYTVDTQADYHRYDFEFRVVDAMGNESDDAYKASVTVAPVNDKPKAESAEFTIKENSVTTTMLTSYAEGDIGATDVENDVLTYSFDLTADTRTAEYYEHVAELYDIEPATGKIFVKEGAKLDYESTDSLLYIKVKVTDDGHTTADPDDAKDTTVVVTIRMVDVNEPPTVADTTFIIPENLGNDKFVGEVVGRDPDSLNQHGFEHLEYFIDPTNSVANAAFKIVDPTKGNITVKNSTKLDYETVPGHKFEFDVLVRNCEYDAVKKDYTANCLEDVVSHVTVELTDEGEPPIIIPICEGDECPTICQGDKCVECKDESCHEECVENCDKPNDPVDVLTVSVNENSRQNYEIMRYLVRDEDFGVGHSTALTAEIKNTTVNTGAEDLFGAKMETDADGNWNVVVYVADSSKLDYETLDFYTHDVTINVRDPEDADGVHGSLLRVIKVVDVNEAPTITGVEDLNGDYKGTKDDFTFYPKEDLVAGGPVGYVHTYDPDVEHLNEFGYREFSLDNPDNYPFEMKDSLLVLTKKLDYEKDSKVYTFDVIVNNCERAKNSAGKYEKINPPKCTEPVKQTVTVKLQDVPEPPKIIPVCEGGNCAEICKGDKCEVCVGETCDEHEICTDNCDNPRGDDPAKTLTVAVKEHSQTGHKIISYAVRDEDYGVGHTSALTAEIRNTNGSGADTLFEAKMVKDIDGNWNVVVSVIDSAKLDYEKINETHNVTIYVYDPEDSDGMYDSLLRVIKVVDVNEAPKAEDADFKPEENLPDSAVVGELMVVEPDTNHITEFGHLEYSIIGKDETFVFAMDSNRVIVNDPSMMDYELPVHFYTFDVLIANCELNKTSGKYDVACLYDTAKVTVDIQDVNEKPTIIVDGPIPDGDDDSDSLCVAHCDTTDRGVWKDSILTIGVKENTEDSLLSKTDMVIFQYHIVDPDTGHAMGAKVEWIDFGSSISSSTVKGPDLFDISYDPTTQTIKATVKDEKLLDYEELRKATSREDPDPEYKVGILVTDPNGLKDTLIRVIRIIDVNEKPLYTAEPCVVVEGNHPGDSIGHVEHPSDIDSLSRNPALYDNQFKITGGDFDRFELRKDSTDLMRVMLVALDSIDCENGSYVCGVDSVYWVELTYGDTTLKTVYNNIRIPVKVLDLNEPPEFRTDTIGVAENSPMGTVVDTIKWFDWDRFDTTMHFEISSDPSGCFAIDKNTGIVTVKKDRCAVLDHEKNPTLKIEVAITDMVDVTDRSLISGGPNTVKKIIMVNVRDVNEPPTIIEETFSVDEDAKKGSVVDTVKATDPDKDPKFNKLIFTAIGGDTATFKIDSITGIVTLKDTLDYETKSKYELVVRVYDGEYADTAIVPIYVNNKIEKTEVKITLYDDSTKVWRDPDTVFTNSPGREICWVQGRSDRDLKDTCMDVHITKDSVIVIRYKDPTTDSYGVDSLFIFYSNATPIVTISGDQEANLANNFYTIVEDTDKGDTNLYVNECKKDVRVTVKDPANKKDTSFVVKLNLQTVNVPQKTLDAVNKIVNENRFVLNENPKGGVTRTPVNGNEVKYSYREVFGKDTVTVSYMTDNDGNPVLVPVLNDKGKVDSIEVMTVSYNVVIDGKTVTISFVVNAATGEVLVKDSNGTLMESGASKVASSSSSKGDATSSSSSNKSSVTEGMFLITYSVKDPLGNSTTVSYSVDEKGKMVQNADGDTGYAVAYTYTNKYGNSATQSLFIVLDQKGPTVEILKPLKGQVIRSNYVEVVWTVNGEIQDTLTVQGLDKGPNYIKRFYRDKAGNEAADTVLVIMKDSKDVEIAVVTPVTEMNPDEVKEYYEENPPEEGETFAVSILNPTSGKEVETLKGGSFKTKKGSGEELYPGKEKKHLGPTLALDVKLPTIKDGEGNTGLGGLATLDDLVLPNGKISNIGIGIDTSKLSDELKREYKEYTVEEYVEKFCEDGTSVPSDLSKFNMYKTKMQVNIWVYTSLGNFVDYFSFGQEMNDPEYTNDAGKLKMFFEMKPDKDGFVKADNGKLYATGAYLYKVEATIRSTLRCTILDEAVLHDKPNAKRKGDKIKSDDELLKPFGYKRPKTK